MTQAGAPTLHLDVVTIHLDQFEALERTFSSLQGVLQSNRVNWIVVDGGSRPSGELDQALVDQVSRASSVFISEPDRGIYPAMNKGTRHSHGDYVLYLNAGDELHPAFSWAAIVDEVGAFRPEMIWGVCHERFPNGSLVRVKNRSPALAWYGIPVNHQNVLFRRDVLGTSPYDTAYRLCADYDLISRILSGGGQAHRSSVPVAIYQRGGLSAQNFAALMEEEEQLRCRHWGLNPALAKSITVIKKLNHRAGRLPVVRRLLRKWI